MGRGNFELRMLNDEFQMTLRGGGLAGQSSLIKANQTKRGIETSRGVGHGARGRQGDKERGRRGDSFGVAQGESRLVKVSQGDDREGQNGVVSGGRGGICSTADLRQKWSRNSLWWSGIEPDQGGSRLVTNEVTGERKWRGALQRISDQIRLNPGLETARRLGECSTAARAGDLGRNDAVEFGHG